MQEQTHHQAQIEIGMKAGLGGRIRDVWKGNLEQEMVILRQLIVKYPYVSMVCVPHMEDHGLGVKRKPQMSRVDLFSTDIG